ncbi:hypothetical protein SH528x_004813 [Novipirellula sp. SH528]|uniref:hypothetical protein n=1 Tax=Novipirellula sp. SH528 TaxID=3454466 RepID=UPI003FA09032
MGHHAATDHLHALYDLSLTPQGPTSERAPLSASFPSWNRKYWAIYSLVAFNLTATIKR